MFDQILALVKEHLGNNPEVAAAIPPGQQEAVHNEIATHVSNGLANQGSQGGFGGLLSMLEGSIASGGTVTSAIEGGLVSSLTSKFGLPPAVTGAIAGALPGILQKFAHKAADAQSTATTTDTISKSITGIEEGGLGSAFNLGK